MKTLIIKFKRESSSQLSFKSATQKASYITSQLSFEYHKCIICSISFSSINRLLNHNQIVTCGKSSCNHYEKIFDFKNKLHDHIRSHEYQKLLFSKSDVVIKTILTKLFTPEKNVTNDTNIIIIKAITLTSVIKSITSHKFNLLAFVSVETSTSLSTYRSVLSSSSIYESYKKLYFIIVDLYMRYVSLSRSRRIINSVIVLLIIFMQKFYEKFYNKKKRVILALNKILDSPIKQYTTRQNLEHAIFERFEFIRSLSKSISKSITQGLIVQ